jgi:hypothetical protein
MIKLDESDLHDSELMSVGVSLDQDERWLLVQRIVTSKYLAQASQLQKILLYVTSQVLLNGRIAIPEHEIACKVLGRRESFNPNDDNIVRVQAGHLRKKLDQYFSSEGRDERYLLVIPRGTYVPHFVSRQNTITSELASEGFGHTTVVSQAEITAVDGLSRSDESNATPFVLAKAHYSNDEVLGAAPLAEQTRSPGWTSRLFGTSGLVWLLVAFSLGVGATVYRYQVNSGMHPVAVAKELPRNFIEQRIFIADMPLSIVATDSSLVLLQNTLHTDIPVSDYIGGQYPANILASSVNPEQRAALENAMAGRYTSLGDLTIAGQVQERAQRFGVSTTLRYARYMSVREFEKGNFILIGSRRGNPWISLFEPQLNFALEEDKETHLFHFLNKNPSTGEEKIYANQQQPHGDYVSYVDIALTPNLTKTGYVLLLNGSVMDSNEAAAHLIFGGDLPGPLLETLGHELGSDAEAEVFLRVHSLEGAPSKYDVIAVRHSRT